MIRAPRAVATLLRRDEIEYTLFLLITFFYAIIFFCFLRCRAMRYYMPARRREDDAATRTDYRAARCYSAASSAAQNTARIH